MKQNNIPQVIYIVDDDEIYHYVMKRLIDNLNMGIEIKFFISCKDALDFIKENITNNEILSDIVFLDINTPYMTGWEFLEQFERIKPQILKEISIYLTSVLPEENSMRNAIAESKIKGYFVKHMDNEKMLKVILKYQAKL